METIKKQLEDAGYDFAVAVATQAEIDAGAACGQLSIICESAPADSQIVQPLIETPIVEPVL
jgi:hypothetical protein